MGAEWWPKRDDLGVAERDSQMTIRLTVLAVLFVTKPAAAELLVADGRESPLAIQLREEHGACEGYAAEELRDHLRKMTGASLPIQKSKAVPARALLISRPGQRAEVAPPKPLPIETFHIRVDGQGVSIRGGGERGLLYGVYGLLERLGCRWFTSEVSHVPERPTLRLEAIEETERPAFEYREIFCLEAFDGTWSARNRLNGSRHRTMDRQGGGLRFARPSTHTYHFLLPPAKHFAGHPDYFPLIGKARKSQHAQLCLTHPDVRRLVGERLKVWAREQPKATLFPVSQMDWGGSCQCERCVGVDTEESESLPYRAWSGAVLRFANEMASRIEKEFPQKLVTTLAYGYTEAPPKKARAARNVRVRFCPIRACQVHSWEKCSDKTTVETLAHLKRWSELDKNLHVWHYGVCFPHYLMPFPNLRALGPQLQLCRRLGVRGLMWQTGDSRSTGVDLGELRSYLLSRLMWSPDADVEAVVKEFVQGVYGPAAPAVLSYLGEVHRPVESADNHLACGARLPVPFYDQTLLSRCRDHLSAARRAAKVNRRVLTAVRKLELGVEYVALWNEKALLPPLPGRQGAAPRVSPEATPQQLARLRGFLRACRELRIGRLSESVTVADLSKTIPLPTTQRTVEHPNLLINREELDALRKNLGREPWKSVFAKVLRKAGRTRAYRAYYETGLAYAVTGKQRYLSNVRAALLHAADAFARQGSEKRLSSSHYHEGPRFGNAELAYDLVHGALDPAERERIETWLRQGCEEALIHLSKTRTTPNMKAVAACEVGRKGCVLGEDRFVEWGKEEFKVRIERLRDTGFWREPPTYVFNVLASLTALAEAVHRYDGTDLFRWESARGHSLKSLLDSEFRVAYPIETTGVGRGSIRRLAFGHGATRPPTSGGSDFFLINSPDRPWHGQTNSYQGILEVLQKRFRDPAYAWLLNLNPSRDEATYQLGYAFLTHGETSPSAELKPPPAPSGVYPEMGFALLRADESPRYWGGRGLAAYLQIHGNYYHRTRGEDFQLILSGKGRLLYPQFTVVNYEPRPYQWTEHPIGHNTVVIDGAHFLPPHEQDVERTERHAFHPTAKFVAATGSVAKGVLQTRAVVMTREYVADLFALSSKEPHTYDWALHGIGRLRVSDSREFGPSDDLAGYRWIRGVRRRPTDASWHADWLQRGSGVLPGVGRYGKTWFDQFVGTRVHMVGEAGNAVYAGSGPRLAPPYGRELGNPEGDVPLLLARRENAGTVYAAVHEAYDVRGGTKVQRVEKLAQSTKGYVLAVDADAHRDWVMVGFGEGAARQTVKLQGRDDPSEHFVFRDHAFLRVRDGQLRAEGDLSAFSVFAPGAKGADFSLNGKETPCTLASGYVLYNLPANTVSAKRQEIEQPRRVSPPDLVLSFVPRELCLSREGSSQVALSATNLGGPTEDAEILIASAQKLSLAPDKLQVGALGRGERKEWTVHISATADAPTAALVKAAVADGNGEEAVLPVTVGLTIREDFPDGREPPKQPELRFPGFEDGFRDYVVRAPGYTLRINRDYGCVVSLQGPSGKMWTRGPGGYFSGPRKKRVGSCFDWWGGKVEEEERKGSTVRFLSPTGLRVQYTFRARDWEVAVSGPEAGFLPGTLKGHLRFLFLRGSRFIWNNGDSVVAAANGLEGDAMARNKATGFLLEQPALSRHSLTMSWTRGGAQLHLEGYGHSLSVMNYCGDKPRTWRVSFLNPDETTLWKGKHRPEGAWLPTIRGGSLVADGGFEDVRADSLWAFTRATERKAGQGSPTSPGHCAVLSSTGSYIAQRGFHLSPGKRTVVRFQFRAGGRGRIDIVLEDPTRDGRFEWENIVFPLRARDDGSSRLQQSGPHHWNTRRRRGIGLNFRHAVSEWTPVELGFTVKEAAHPIRLLLCNAVDPRQKDRRVMIDEVYVGQE